MYTNDLHNAYEYERERRNDERRAAAESLRTQGLARSVITLPMTMAGIVIVVVALMYELQASDGISYNGRMSPPCRTPGQIFEPMMSGKRSSV